jgi:hypothetical protein
MTMNAEPQLPKERLSCSGWRPDRHFCAHGFPQNGACGTGSGLPVCCNEAVCARLFPETGKPEKFIEARS